MLALTPPATGKASNPGAGAKPDYAAATARARATLPMFLEKLRQPDHEDYRFSVMVDLAAVAWVGQDRLLSPPSPGHERVWVNDLSPIPGQRLIGALMHTPDARGVRRGQLVVFPIHAVIDWSFTRYGVLQGRFWDREMLKTLPPAQRAHIKAVLGWP